MAPQERQGARNHHPFPPPPAEWSYWELRSPWQGKAQDWKALPTPLFTADTVEDFWMCYSRTPKIM
jgi:hypothetical protein